MIVRKPTNEEIVGTQNWEVWEKEVSVFPWYYEEKETCYLLQGEVFVTDKQGNTIHFEAGDWVEFEKGLECTWNIVKYLKKRYYFEF